MRRNLKLLTQNKDELIDMPGKIWIAYSGCGGVIVNNSSIHPIIGEYATYDRAKEVLVEIFECYRTGKDSYILPDK